MSSSDRDTHFVGFAKLLQKEIERKVVGIGVEDWTPTYSAKMTQDIIARRAYDLAVHVIHMHSAIETRGTILTPAEVIARMPDMTYREEE